MPVTADISFNVTIDSFSFVFKYILVALSIVFVDVFLFNEMLGMYIFNPSGKFNLDKISEVSEFIS